MGLSASQAKLLSITSRLSDNELRSQAITNSKMALTNKTTDAGQEYMNALSQTQLMFSNYDASGNKMTQNLNGVSLMEYAELKNQYGIINPQGQITVSERDGANYLASGDINEFLAKYGVDQIDTGEVRYVKDEAAEAEYDKYVEDYKQWIQEKPPETIQQVKTPAWTEEITPAWTERVHTSELWTKIMGTGCISGSLSNTNCYMHVMASLLGPGTHTTSDGNSFEVFSGDCDDGHTWCWNTDRHPVSADLIQELKDHYPCGETHDETVDIKWGNQVYKVNCKDDNCNPGISVYQKIIDLLWEVHGDYSLGTGTGGGANPEHIAKFWHIVEFDLDEATEVDHPAETVEHEAIMETVENPEYLAWLERKPEEVKLPELVAEKIYKYSDADKAQWYVNLWHRMNGPEDDKVVLNGFQNGEHAQGADLNAGANTDKSPANGLTEGGQLLWTVLEDGLMNSSDWLKNALENGKVSLERVNFSNPTEEGTGLADVTWTSIIYTNATDISEDQNEAAITKAEAKYQSELKDIQAKDKQFDSQIKRLDSEHSALQTEYDSIKSIIDKTLERNLKLYS